jgi:hypothetical protein
MYYEERNRGIMERYEAVEMAFREIESKEIRKVKFLFKESVMIQNLQVIVIFS